MGYGSVTEHASAMHKALVSNPSNANSKGTEILQVGLQPYCQGH